MRAHYTIPAPARPLTDAEWAILAPFFAREASAPGRKLGTDPRTRLDAMLATTATGAPWRETPQRYGRPNTIARHFRRLAQGGTWTALLKAVAHPKAPALLKTMEYWICRLARRAMRHLGMKGLALARQLGLLSALPMWPRYLPKPELSQTLQGLISRILDRARDHRPPPGTFAQLARSLAFAGGRAVWSRRLAPP